MADLNSMLYDVKRLAQHRVELTDEKIKSIYEQLMTDLDGFLASTYRKYSDADGRLYLSYLDEHRQRAAFLQQIVDNVDNITPTLKNEMQSLIDATYEECYKGMAESVKAAYTSAEVAELLNDIDVNPETLQAAVENNISKLTLPAVLEAHRAQIIYQIQQELNIGLLNGDRYETMARRISERVGVSQSKAMNITRTETHRNVESGFMNAAERIQEGLDGSGLIYAATWRTMGDERVRPQVRRKTKSGWKTTWSQNGADHMKMEGQTVKVGEMFNLGNGVKAKAPSQSGVAAHDCNCRCTLEYNLMTVEEFAKATGQTIAQARAKYVAKGKASGINDALYGNGEPVLSGTIDFNDRAAIMGVLDEAEYEFVSLPYEVNRSITADGKVWTISGSKGFVGVEKIQMQRGGSALKGSYSYHNHPADATRYSFSGEDVAFFLDMEEAYSKASDDRYSYFIERTESTPKAGYAEIVAEFKEIERTTIYEMAFNGEIDIDEDGYHEIVKILADKYNFVYERVKK